MANIGSGSGSSYPSAFDTQTSVEVNSPNSNKTIARAEVPNDLAACIMAVQQTLGTNPQGSTADVKTLLQIAHGTDGIHKSGILLPSPQITGTITGTPALGDGTTATTQTATDSTTKVATTAFVQAQKASPAFTGTPTAPTAAQGTTTTQIATTEFVMQNAVQNIPVTIKIPEINVSSDPYIKKYSCVIYVPVQAKNLNVRFLLKNNIGGGSYISYAKLGIGVAFSDEVSTNSSTYVEKDLTLSVDGLSGWQTVDLWVKAPSGFVLLTKDISNAVDYATASYFSMV